FKGSTYPGTGGTCGAIINSGASCTIVVSFEPAIAGAQSDTIEINYNNGVIVTSTTRDVEGTGAAPANLTISESDPYDFGTFATGASQTHTFTVNNTGGVTATSMGEVGLSAPFGYLGGTYPGAGG